MTLARLSRTAGIPLRYANRHGLITGATGTGKTVSLMRLVEQFSSQGVPVFVADVKGDIAALCRSCPCSLLDLFGESGLPLRATVAGFAPDTLARALELTDAQAGALEVAFAYAADTRLPFNTLADLRAVLVEILARRADVSAAYGQVTATSVAVIQRALLRIEGQGGDRFFDAPAFDVAELMPAGRVSILVAEKLMQSPRVYSAFLLWLLTDLYQRLPEVGDMDKPRLVFFFDEAHLLFQDCPPALLRRIEQTVRLIRSKGIGVYFVSQSPDDIPHLVREQLAHRIEHDRRLAVGTAIFTTMNSNGRPVAPALVRVELPACQLGALSPVERRAYMPEPVAAVPARAMPSIRAPFATDIPPWAEIIVLTLGAATVAAIVGGLVYMVQTGTLGTAAAIAAGAYFALRGKLP